MKWLLLAALVVAPVVLAGCNEPTFEWPDVLPAECESGVGGGLRCQTVVDGLASPVRVAFHPAYPGAAFIVEQGGLVRVAVNGILAEQPFLDLRDLVGTCHYEQGLLGFAFDPARAAGDRAFVAYTEDAPCSRPLETRYGKGDLVLHRITLAGGNVTPTWDSEQLLQIREPYRNHNGGHIAFGPDGYLWLGVGDGGDHGDPLKTGGDPTDHLGSLLRIDVSAPTGYRIPADNPFQDRADGAPEVWAYGLRNPWRFSFHDREVWVADVGQACQEEVTRLNVDTEAGANLGWSTVEGRQRFTTSDVAKCPQPRAPADADLVAPLHVYDHDDGACSITGGGHVAPDTLPGLAGAYLFADFCTGRLSALVPDGDVWQPVTIMDTGLQVTGIDFGPGGEVYLLHWGGSLHRIVADADAGGADATDA